MLADLDTTLKASLRRVRLERWVSALRTHLIVALLVCGGLVLLSRSLFDMPRGTAALFLLGLLLTPLTAWLQARRGDISQASAAAWLDLRAGGDGSIVTALEREDPRWTERVRRALAAQPAVAPIAMNGAMSRTMPAIGFLVLALWIEMPRGLLGPDPALFDGAIERLEEKLETLLEIVELEPEAELEFRERLERLEAEAEAGNPESFYEAADSLEESLETAASELAEEANELERDLAAVADADESLAEEAEEMLRESLTELSELGLAADLSRKLDKELSPDMELDSELMRELSEELKEALEEKLLALQEAGLIDPSRLRKLDPSDLAKLREAAAKSGKPKLGEPCDCAECKKAGKKTGSKDCKGEGACHAKACMDAGHCVGGGT